MKVVKKEIEIVPEAIYPAGQLISPESRTEKEINGRINLSWKKFWRLGRIFKGNFQNDQKWEIFNTRVAPVLTYGSPTWSLLRDYPK